MQADKIKSILINALDLQQIYVNCSDSHCKIIAIDERFAGIKQIEQHQIIYAPLSDAIIANELHAITIKTFTSSQWQTAKKSHCIEQYK